MKSIIKLVLVGVSFIIPGAIKAQKLTMGVRGGINVSNVKINGNIDSVSTTIDVESNNSFIGGLVFNFESKHNFVYGFELNALNRGFVNTVRFVNDSGRFIGAFPNEYDIKSISIPTYFGKKFGNMLFIGFNIGIAPIFIYKAHADSTYQLGNSESLATVSQDIKENLNEFNIDGHASLFLGGTIRKRLILQADLRLQQSFSDLYKNGTYDNVYFGSSTGFNVALSAKYILWNKENRGSKKKGKEDK